MRDGHSELNYAVYHDRFKRTPDGWKFAERVYEIRYLDSSQLAGSAPFAGSAHGGSLTHQLSERTSSFEGCTVAWTKLTRTRRLREVAGRTCHTGID